MIAAVGQERVFFSAIVEGRRGEILDAAFEVFSAKNYEGGTMRDIARRVGVSEPAIYRYYESKEALFEDLVALAGEHMVAKVTSAFFSAVEPGSVRSSLLLFLQMRRNTDIMGGPSLMGTLVMAASNRPEFCTVMNQRLRTPMLELVGRFITKIDGFYGIDRDEIERKELARVFMSLFVGSFITQRAFGEKASAEADSTLVNSAMAIMGWPNETMDGS